LSLKKNDSYCKPLSNNLDWALQNKILKSGIELQFPVHLDGGGYEMVDELVDVIRKTGKTFYNRACEWCAGFGVLGFEVLGLGLTKHIVFTDYYHVAIDTCLENARKNHLINHVSGHVSGTINDIPNIEKWDLVVSNPPHCVDLAEFEASMKTLGNTNQQNIDNAARICVDQDYKIHDEFFKNIGKHLTHDADIYLIECQYMESTVHMASLYGLNFMGKYEMKDKTMPMGVILHFKP
jgi:methylase of polypeptide subunit release factors